jgi:uncharacterized protein YlxP (DUF503 family)
MPAVVGLATVTLQAPEAMSLKDKRRVVKSLIARLRARYNVAVAEVDAHDTWRTIALGIVCVSTDAAHAHAMLEKAMATIEHERLDVMLVDYQIELL